MGPCLVILVLLSVLSRPLQGSHAEVECVMNLAKVLTCTWNHPHPPAQNYTFYYWKSSDESKAIPCPEYLAVNYTNIGCKLSVSDPYETFGVKLNGSSSPGPLIKKTFRTHQDFMKMDPPSNLSIERTENYELMLKWVQWSGNMFSHCVMYRVKHRNTAGDSWTEKDASSTFFVLPSFDECQNYTFHVKSKMSDMCANAFMWSEWSEGVTWARNATACDKPPKKSALKFLYTSIFVGMTLLLVVIILAVIGQERIWVILVPQIPNPGKKFEDLINGCNAQEWVGVSKEAVEKMKLSYTETLCTVTEDPECAEGRSLTCPSP